LAESDPFEMPGATAPVSSGLIRLALDHALAHRFSVLLEGTFRDPDMVVGTAVRFAGAGYRVEVVAVATPGMVSRLSAEQRSLGGGDGRFGRWTPPGAHESGLAGSSGVVAALEASPVVRRVTVRSRERVLYENERAVDGQWGGRPRAAEVLAAEQGRRLTPTQAVDWMARYRAVFEAAAGRPGYLNRLTAPAYRALERDAVALIPVVAVDPAVDSGVLRREADERGRLLAARSDMFSVTDPS
jgi:hypothetical protein